MIRVPQAWALLKDAVNGWIDDRAPSMGAALAFYTAFSIAPLLVIAIAVAGLVFGHDTATRAVIGQFQALMGDVGATAVSDALQGTAELGDGLTSLAVGLGALLIGATTAFVELQDDLDRIFRAEPRIGSGFVNLFRTRLVSFAMVLFVGFLLTVSLVLSAGIAAVGRLLSAPFEALLQVMTFGLSFGVVTALFALIYKVLPDIELGWRNVLVGAAVTALLFEIGKLVIGLYIGKSAVAASFGAAGPFVVLMLWVYYSTQIFLLGAELTRAHAARRPVTLDRTTPALMAPFKSSR